MQRILFFSLLIFCSSAFCNARYTEARVTFKNNTTHIEAIQFHDTEGRWKHPITTQPILLKPNKTYNNTLISLKNHHHYNNALSAMVSQANDPHNNYLIFGEETISKDHYLTAHIFDGIGHMFVDSWTNHCSDTTSSGHANCKLTIASRS